MPRILIVDDNLSALGRMKQLLDAGGHEVENAHFPGLAKELAEEQDFDLTLIDGLDGRCFELISWFIGNKKGGILVAYSSDHYLNSEMMKDGCRFKIQTDELNFQQRVEKIKEILTG